VVGGVETGVAMAVELEVPMRKVFCGEGALVFQVYVYNLSLSLSLTLSICMYVCMNESTGRGGLSLTFVFAICFFFFCKCMYWQGGRCLKRLLRVKALTGVCVYVCVRVCM